MAYIKYCLPITMFCREKCHKLSIVVECALLPKLGFNMHTSKEYGGKGLMHVHIEQLILQTESFMVHLRGQVEIGNLQRILLNK